jgi:plastocyanin
MSVYRHLFAFLSVIVILGVTACSGSGTAAGPPPPKPPVATTAAVSGKCPASAGLPSNVNDHGAAAASGSQLSIEAHDSFFSPTCMTGVPSGTVTLKVHNAGKILHNMSIPELHIDEDVPSGQTIQVQVKMGSKPLMFFCKYHRASGMLGALIPS